MIDSVLIDLLDQSSAQDLQSDQGVLITSSL